MKKIIFLIAVLSIIVTPTKVLAATTNKTCAIVDDIRYGKNGNVVDEVTYYEECCNYTCTVVDNKYYFDSKGNSTTYEAMLEDCKSTEVINPQTGINTGYIVLPLGILCIIGIIKISKKNTKIYKI